MCDEIIFYLRKLNARPVATLPAQAHERSSQANFFTVCAVFDQHNDTFSICDGNGFDRRLTRLEIASPVGGYNDIGLRQIDAQSGARRKKQREQNASAIHGRSIVPTIFEARTRLCGARVSE